MVIDSLNGNKNIEHDLEDGVETLKEADYAGARLLGKFIEGTNWESYWFEEGYDGSMPTMDEEELTGLDGNADTSVLQDLERSGYLQEFDEGYTVPLESVDRLWSNLREDVLEDRVHYSVRRSLGR